MKLAAHPGSARADQLKLWTDNLFNDRLNCIEGRTQGTLDVVPLGQELWCVVTHGDRSLPVLPNERLEREIQTRARRRKHYRRAHSRLSKHDEFRIGYLHTNSFGCAAVINDPEQREASIPDHTRQSVDGLCDGLAAVLGDDPGQRLRVVQGRARQLRIGQSGAAGRSVGWTSEPRERSVIRE
jgi:hypothetical protein